MKVSWSDMPGINAVGLVATPGEIDGYPLVGKLAVGAAPVTLTADRLAVASVLAFSAYQSGQLTLDKPISALTAKTISNFFAPRWTHVTPLHPSNLPIPRGHVVLYVAPEGNDIEAPDGCDITLSVQRSDWATGIHSIGDTVSIASNAWMHTVGEPQSFEYYLPFLAVAVLFSEDLSVDRIVLPKNVQRDASMQRKVQDLLACAGLGLQS